MDTAHSVAIAQCLLVGLQYYIERAFGSDRRSSSVILGGGGEGDDTILRTFQRTKTEEELENCVYKLEE